MDHYSLNFRITFRTAQHWATPLAQPQGRLLVIFGCSQACPRTNRLGELLAGVPVHFTTGALLIHHCLPCLADLYRRDHLTSLPPHHAPVIARLLRGEEVAGLI